MDISMGALMDMLSGGELHCVASDHRAHSQQQKQLGQKDFTRIPHGVNGVEERLSIVWEFGVHSGKMHPTKFVAVTSTNAAKIFNLYPKKGRIAAGADADLVVWDSTAKQTVSRTATESQADFNIFEGKTLHGIPLYTVYNGHVAFDQGKVSAEAGSGRFLPLPNYAPFVYSVIQQREKVCVPTKVERDPAASLQANRRSQTKISQPPESKSHCLVMVGCCNKVSSKGDEGNVETADCHRGTCDLLWTDWGAWTPCIRSCGGGDKRRFRGCLGPGACQPLANNTQVKQCNTIDCAKMWTSWTQWSSCSMSCSEAHRQRKRTCPSKPVKCDGASMEHKPCDNAVTCPPPVANARVIVKAVPEPRCGAWWSSCTQTCGGGRHNGKRNCAVGLCSTSTAEREQWEGCHANVCPSPLSEADPLKQLDLNSLGKQPFAERLGEDGMLSGLGCRSLKLTVSAKNRNGYKTTMFRPEADLHFVLCIIAHAL